MATTSMTLDRPHASREFSTFNAFRAPLMPKPHAPPSPLALVLRCELTLSSQPSLLELPSARMQSPPRASRRAHRAGPDPKTRSTSEGSERSSLRAQPFPLRVFICTVPRSLQITDALLPRCYVAATSSVSAALASTFAARQDLPHGRLSPRRVEHGLYDAIVAARCCRSCKRDAAMALAPHVHVPCLPDYQGPAQRVELAIAAVSASRCGNTTLEACGNRFDNPNDAHGVPVATPTPSTTWQRQPRRSQHPGSHLCGRYAPTGATLTSGIYNDKLDAQASPVGHGYRGPALWTTVPRARNAAARSVSSLCSQLEHPLPALLAATLHGSPAPVPAGHAGSSRPVFDLICG
ncbi:hypothetical protein B0H15DRAFT_958328 [Mycena belliarum]|uniref:Uncharacterized protein n=1 Tax=Mycena belliarum TaxID=1033014 RepID=A0AAD6TLZ6_9AGAR|nr:hypothetical protein B0H15DRAFT_958328 [Mycena belliae]